MDKTLFLFHKGQTFPNMAEWVSRSRVSFIRELFLKFARHLENRRNPRAQEYMIRLAQRVFPSFHFSALIEVHNANSLPEFNFKEIDKIVLLWPDSNGTGWANIEREIFRRKSRLTNIHVLNGRGRNFVLDARQWAKYKLRRCLEKTLALEMVTMFAMIIITPMLALADLLRGKR